MVAKKIKLKKNKMVLRKKVFELKNSNYWGFSPWTTTSRIFLEETL